MTAENNVYARVMVPVVITESMLGAGTNIPEPDTANGEVAWVSGQNYAIDDKRTYAGSVWSCVRQVTGRTETPDKDPGYWLRQGPTNRMAPFDDYSSTKTRSKSIIKYVINPGFVNGINVYGPEGATYKLEARDTPGGPITKEKHGDLYAQAAGFWELLFTPLPALESISLDGINISPTTEITVIVEAPSNGNVAVGDIKVGDWRVLIGTSAFGGVEYGAEAQRKTYTYREYNKDGTYKQIPRGKARDVNCRVVLDSEQAMYADAVMGEIIDLAVPFEATNMPKYGYLNTLGFVSGTIRADNWGMASLSLTIKGNI